MKIISQYKLPAKRRPNPKEQQPVQPQQETRPDNSNEQGLASQIWEVIKAPGQGLWSGIRGGPTNLDSYLRWKQRRKDWGKNVGLKRKRWGRYSDNWFERVLTKDF